MSVFQFRVGGSRTAQRFVIEAAPQWWIPDKSRGPHCERCHRDLHIEWATPWRGVASCQCTPCHGVEQETNEL
jgi:hypothetical protein